MIASLSPAGVRLGVVEEVAPGVVRRLHALHRQVVLHLDVERHPRPERQHRHLDPRAAQPAVAHLSHRADATDAGRPPAATGRTVTPRSASSCFGLGDRVLAEVEDRRRQHGVGAAVDDPLDEVLERADPAAGDHRHADRLADRAGQLEVEAVAGAVAVHRRQQDLAGAERGDRPRPTRRRRCRSACARRAGTPRTSPPGRALGVDGAHHALGAELGGDLADQLRPLDRGGVDADLVGAGAQHAPGVVDGADRRRRR